MREFLNYFQTKGNLVNLLVLLVLVVALPVGIYLTRQQQILKSQAAIEPIVFLEGGCVQKQGTKVVATCPDVNIQLTSPLGPPASSSSDLDKDKDKDKDKKDKKDKKEDKKQQKEEKKKDKGEKKKDKKQKKDDSDATLNPLFQILNPKQVYAGHEDDACIAAGDCNTNEYCDDANFDPPGRICRNLANGSHECTDTPCESGGTDFCKDSEYVFKKCDPDDCGFEIWSCPKNGANKIVKTPSGGDCVNPSKNPVCQSQGGSGSCNIGFQSPSFSDACVNHLKSDRYCDTGTCLVESIREKDSPKFANCSDTQVLNYWCNGGVTGGKTNPDCTLKKKEGGSACGTSGSNNGSKNGKGDSGGNGKGGDKNKKTPPPQQGNTTSFKLAETPDGLASASAQPYDQHPKIIPHTFSSSAPGIKTIFVEFISKSGQKEQRTASIELVAPAPQVSLAKCSLASFGEGINLELTGQRFGALPGQLTLKGLANSSATITGWSDSQLSATVNLPPGAEALKNVNFVLTRSDGASIEGACLVGEETISLALGTKLFCRADSSFDQKGVEIVILEDTPGTKVKKEIVTVDRDGVVDLKTRFVNGKLYRVSVKAHRSLRRSSQPFTASEGTVQLTFARNEQEDINTNALPIGDIFPTLSGDGKIDTRDALELFRQWGSPLKGAALSSSLRPGDFNQDGKVNVIDWACMRYDFGTSDDEPLK